MTTESSLWKWLKKASSKDIYLERIENIASPGFADVFGYHKSYGAFFIELKQCKKPLRITSKLLFDIRKAQIVWHRRMTSAGANTWLLIKIGCENYLFQGKFLNPDLAITMDDERLINVSTLNQVQLIEFLLKYK